MSLFGTKAAPYRPICGGWPAPTFSGDCFQHYRRADAAIPIFLNVTKVDDYTGMSMSGIIPYARPNPDGIPSGGDCDLVGAPDCSPGQKKCGPWPKSERPPGADGIACPTLSVGDNCFDTTADTTSFAKCRKLGFKNVQARKFWHGKFPYTNPDQVGEALNAIPTTFYSPDCTCDNYEPEHGTIPCQTKYRTEEITEEDHRSATTGGTGDFDRISNRKVTVGANDGRQVRVSYSDTDTGAGSPNTFGTLGTSGYTTATPKTLQYCISQWYNLINGSFSATSAEISGSPGEWTFGRDLRDGSGNGDLISTIVSLSGGYLHHDLKTYGNVSGTDGVLAVEEKETVDLTATSSVWYKQLNIIHSGFRAPLPIGNQEYTLTGILTDAYADSAVYSAIVDMLDEWDLTDDKVYPWRVDQFVSAAPMVKRDEYHGVKVPYAISATIFNNIHNGAYPGTGDDAAWIASHQSGWTEEGYEDSGAAGGTGTALPAAYSGDLLGAPLPGGYNRYFDFDHKTWRCCDSSGPQFYLSENGAYGSFNGGLDSLGGEEATDHAIPHSATAWTENHLEADLWYAGAWVLYDGTALIAQKWAEIKNPRPSYNFFGPCGEDRFRYDETKVGCVDTYDSGTKVVTLLAGVTGMTSGVGLICGIDPTVDGVWNFTRTDDSHYTLTGSRLYTAPSRDDCTNPTFGKLRFPDAWPICGRVAVTSSSIASGTVTIHCAAAPYLRTGDHVDFTDVDGAVIESNKTVTVISETEFTFSGSIPTGVFVVSNVGAVSAPLWWWYDNRPKGSYLWAEWTHNLRDYQERDRAISQYGSCGCSPVTDPGAAIRPYQEGHGMPRSVSAFDIGRDCLSWTPCAPQVLCYSPNAESFTNGVTRAFPETFSSDERYSSLWQAAFVQEVVDYSYQPIQDPDTDTIWNEPWDSPHEPCDVQAKTDPTATWQEDDGTCIEDDDTDHHYYYRHRPYVEPEIALPVVDGHTAPSLPSGLYLAFITSLGTGTNELNHNGSIVGNVLPPPAVIGNSNNADATPNQPVTPWSLYVLQMTCVCADPAGRFETEYSDDLVLC